MLGVFVSVFVCVCVCVCVCLEWVDPGKRTFSRGRRAVVVEFCQLELVLDLDWQLAAILVLRVRVFGEGARLRLCSLASGAHYSVLSATVVAGRCRK